MMKITKDQPRLDLFIQDGIAYFRRNGEIITAMTESIVKDCPDIVDKIIEREMDKP